MSQILLEFDNQLKLSDIVVPLTNASKTELEQDTQLNPESLSETSVNGILTPLILINNTLVRFDNVIYFELSTTGLLPNLFVKVLDDSDIQKTLDIPKNDNSVRVLILPPFDNAYKKIDLTFLISDIDITDGVISLMGVYKVPELYLSQYKCFGEINTYDLCKKIATELKLGFATNIKSSDDKRYIYCNNISYQDLLELEISQSGDENFIYDCWIDFWNNINLVDIKERYETVDPEEEMLIWVTNQYEETTEDAPKTPELVGALLNNNPLYQSSELYVGNYSILNSQGSNIADGTDKVKCYWNMDENKLEDLLIMDGDVKKDVYINREYAGEIYGSYNYFKSRNCRDAFMQKINNEGIIVHTKTPLLALMRGSKVDFTWYNTDEYRDIKEKELKEAGFINENLKTNIPLTEGDVDMVSSGGTFKIDKQVSGQYLITNSIITYNNEVWDYLMELHRPTTSNDDLLNVPEE